MLEIVLFGCTELTIKIANMLNALDMCPKAIVTSEKFFKISYAPSGVTNTRHVDMMEWAMERGIPCHVYRNPQDLFLFINDHKSQFGLVAGWYHMVPKQIRDLFSLGCGGVHASLLPKLRGGAPLNWAILNGESKTGVSFFKLENGIDDGDLFGQLDFQINDNTSITELVEASHEATLQLLSTKLPELASGRIIPFPQKGMPTYCLQRNPEDGYIDWSAFAQKIDRLIRAVTRPYYPGAFTFIEDKKIIIWKAKIFHSNIDVYGAPGQILSISECQYPIVVTGAGCIELHEAEDSEGNSVLSVLKKSSQKRFQVFSFNKRG